jgi:hypothetical protein
MGLKKLSRFQVFDANGFFAKKEMLLTKVEAWQEGEDADHLQTKGTKITAVIYIDNTAYGTDLGLNRGETLTFKVAQPVSSFATWRPFNTRFKVNSFTKVSVYGDFRNQLSIKVPSLVAVGGAGAVATKKA